MKLVATENDIGQRLDAFLAIQIPEVSRSFIKKLCEDTKVTINKQPVKGSHILKGDEHIQIDFDPRETSKVPVITIPILYEDNDCLVIDKPVGLLSHSKGAYNPEPTVASFIAQFWQDGTSNERTGVVHRLDRATSGLMIAAKNTKALLFLQKQFNQRKTKKTYFAIVSGHLSPPEAIIDMPIARNPKNPKTFHTSSLGKPSQTHYKVIESSGNYDLVELQPTTGRTHQLRVHLAHLHHPIVGDEFYKGEPADRLYLHAESLAITLPNGKAKTFNSLLPPSFQSWLEQHHG